jgi:ABC-type phosphate transport system substrate-binding protein
MMTMRSSSSWARRGAPATLFLFLALTVGAGTASAQSAYKVIVNPASTVSTVTKVELSALFLKKTARWADGTPAAPVDLPDNADARAQFSRDVLGKPASAIRAYWNQMIFSGRNVPPALKDSEADVVAYVRSTPGAVGYVKADTATPGVKVVAVRS